MTSLLFGYVRRSCELAVSHRHRTRCAGVALVALIAAWPHAAAAQEQRPQGSDRRLSSDREAQAYLGVTLARLIVALGLQLRGSPFQQQASLLGTLHTEQSALSAREGATPTSTPAERPDRR